VLLGGSAAQTLLASLILCSVLLLGVSLHESAHLYVLRRRACDPWLGYLSSFSSIKVRIRRPRIDGEQLDHEVAVSGPLCPVKSTRFLARGPPLNKDTSNVRRVTTRYASRYL
jgi:hypothetical protein